MRKRACSLEAIESMIAYTQRKSARKVVFLQVTVSISPGNYISYPVSNRYGFDIDK